jgi:hypothetical protein
MKKYDFRDYVRRFERHSAFGTLSSVASLDEPGGPYPLLSLEVPGSRWLTLTGGFHGEEPAPPLTFLERMPEIVDYAQKRDVGLRIYPCINPSGFEDGTRYNRSGEKPNNDFIRYELHDGKIAEEVDPHHEIRRWHLHDTGPKETVIMRRELSRHPTPVAALDLHQDRYLDGAHTYAYVFRDRTRYHHLTAEAARHVKLASAYKADERHVTDDAGLIEHHDGSVSDYFHRRGVRHVACLETTTDTPMEACHEVNMVWIRGFIDFVAETPDDQLPRE